MNSNEPNQKPYDIARAQAHTSPSSAASHRRIYYNEKNRWPHIHSHDTFELNAWRVDKWWKRKPRELPRIAARMNERTKQKKSTLNMTTHNFTTSKRQRAMTKRSERSGATIGEMRKICRPVTNEKKFYLLKSNSIRTSLDLGSFSVTPHVARCLHLTIELNSVYIRYSLDCH